jgi:hypothetical protein
MRATLQLTKQPRENNEDGVSSISITVDSDRQLTSSLGQKESRLLISLQVASLADDSLVLP